MEALTNLSPLRKPFSAKRASRSGVAKAQNTRTRCSAIFESLTVEEHLMLKTVNIKPKLLLWHQDRYRG